MERKMIYLIDAVLLVGTILAISGIMFYGGGEITGLIVGPTLNEPSDGLVTTRAVLFSIENADVIFIDDNAEFTSPEIMNVHDGLEVVLEPGLYYWKANGLRDSEIRTLTIESRVELRLRETDEGYEVVNGGNARLNVDVYENGVLKDKVVIDVDEGKILEGDRFIGGEYE